MKKQKKILVLGFFGYETNQLDGQTVKTRMVYRLLNEEGGDRVVYFDMQKLKKHKAAVFELIKLVFICRYIVYLPARRNLTFIFPVLFLVCFLMRKRISYFVIGGWLPAYAGRKRYIRVLLRYIQHIFVETRAMEKQLTGQLGFRNVAIFPNFRFFNFTPKPLGNREEFRMVFMSRVTRLKGVDVIFRMAERLQAEANVKRIVIDFYGPVNDQEKEWFLAEVEKFNGMVSYKGKLQPEQIFEALSQYDVMLFPTRYPGEGCPGAIIDAYISGIPVIASDWKYNSEFVEDGVTGIIYDPGNEDSFLASVHELMADMDKLSRMKKAAVFKSREYSQDIAKQLMVKYDIL